MASLSSNNPLLEDFVSVSKTTHPFPVFGKTESPTIHKSWKPYMATFGAQTLKVKGAAAPAYVPDAVLNMLAVDGLYMIHGVTPILVRGGKAYSINVATLEVDSALSEHGWNPEIKKENIKRVFV